MTKFANILVLICAALPATAFSVAGGGQVPAGSPFLQSTAKIGIYLQAENPPESSAEDPSEPSFCTGALIAPKILLTAAHCITGSEKAHARFVVNFFDPNRPDQVLKSVSVIETIPHPRFNQESGDFDIGIIRLSEAVDSPWQAFPIAGLDKGAQPSSFIPLEKYIALGMGQISVAANGQAELAKRLKQAELSRATPLSLAQHTKQISKKVELFEDESLENAVFWNSHFRSDANTLKDELAHFGSHKQKIEAILTSSYRDGIIMRGDSGGPIVQMVNGQAQIVGVIIRTTHDIDDFLRFGWQPEISHTWMMKTYDPESIKFLRQFLGPK